MDLIAKERLEITMRTNAQDINICVIMSKKYSYYILILFLLIVSTLMKVHFIDARELWLDETLTTYLISNPFQIMMAITIGDVHPPLYSLCLKAWAEVFGYTPHSLRAFSLMANLLFEAILLFTAKIIFRTKWIVLICFSLIIFSPDFFYYSIEVRDYMFCLVFVATAFYFYAKIIASQDAPVKYHFLFAISSALAFYSHYFSLFIIISFCFHYLLFCLIEKKPIKPFLLGVLLFSMLTTPWIPTLIHQKQMRLNNSDTIRKAETLPDTLNYGYHVYPKRSAKDFFVWVYHFTDRHLIDIDSIKNKSYLVKWSVGIFKALVIIVFLLSILRKDKFAILISIISLIYILCMFLVSIPVIRYFLFLTVFIIFGICIAFERMKEYPIGKYLSILTCLFAVFSFIIHSVTLCSIGYCKPTTEAVKYIQHNYTGSDIIIFNDLIRQVPFDYYAGLSNFSPREIGFPVNIYDWWAGSPYKGWGGPIIGRKDMEQFIERLVVDKQIKRIWLLSPEQPKYDPGQQLLKALSEHYKNVDICDYYQFVGKCDGMMSLYLLSN
jgi:hypothetical protein